MIVYAKISGDTVVLAPDTTVQGSIGANVIDLLAPFPKTAAVAVAVTLPTGQSTTPTFADAKDATLITGNVTGIEEDGKELNIWRYTFQKPLTQFAGSLTVQFFITTSDATTALTPLIVPIVKGVPFIMPKPDEASWNAVQQLYNRLLDAEQNATDAAKSAEDAVTNAQKVIDDGIVKVDAEIDKGIAKVDAEVVKAEEYSNISKVHADDSASSARDSAQYAQYALQSANNAEVIVRDITEVIPADASADNKLTTESFVNSSIATNTATFRGTYDLTAEQLNALPWQDTDPNGNYYCDNNDYVFLTTKKDGQVTAYSRYKCVISGTPTDSITWEFEYTLNNSSFTDEQWAAINSGITAAIVNSIPNIHNLSDGTVSGALNQLFDGGDTLDFTGKNPNAVAAGLLAKLGESDITKLTRGATGQYASSFGGTSIAKGKRGHAEGTNTISAGNHSHAEGDNSVSLGNDSHAEGYQTTAWGDMSHSEGAGTVSAGGYSHAEGLNTRAGGTSAHAGGTNTKASGNNSTATGLNTEASGDNSTSEGNATKASGANAHSEGYQSSAEGENAHAGGNNALARGRNSMAHGSYCIARKANQHILGQSLDSINLEEGGAAVGVLNDSKANDIFEVGNGTSETERSNAFRVLKDGRAKVQTAPKEDDDVVTMGSIKPGDGIVIDKNETGDGVEIKVDPAKNYLTNETISSGLIPVATAEGWGDVPYSSNKIANALVQRDSNGNFVANKISLSAPSGLQNAARIYEVGNQITITSPAGATNGTLTATQLANLKAVVGYFGNYSNHWILLNNERYYPMSYGHQEGYRTYANVEYESNAFTIKSITVTLSTGAWVLNTKILGDTSSPMYKHCMTVKLLNGGASFSTHIQFTVNAYSKLSAFPTTAQELKESNLLGNYNAVTDVIYKNASGTTSTRAVITSLDMVGDPVSGIYDVATFFTGFAFMGDNNTLEMFEDQGYVSLSSITDTITEV